MLASITPLGERSRRQRWALTVTSFVLAAGLAGALAGAALAGAGRLLPIPRDARLDIVLVFAAVALVLDLRPFGFALPSTRRQVDETWLHRYRGWVYGAGFGAQLGVGVSTIVVTPAVYVIFVAELLAPTPAGGAAIGATLGLARGAMLLGTGRVRSPAQLAAFHRRFDRAEPAARVATIATQAVVLVVAASLAL